MSRIPKRYFKRLALVVVAAGLSSCASSPEIKREPQPQIVTPVKVTPLREVEEPAPSLAETLPSRVDLNRAAQIWIDQAYFAQIPERQDLLLRSSGALIEAGRLMDAKIVLDNTRLEGLPPQYSQRKRLLRAQLALAQGNNDLALRYLNRFGSMRGLAPGFRATALSVRARAALAAGANDRALRDLIERETVLVTTEDLSDNRERIWMVLGLLSPIELQVERQSIAEGTPLLDWLDLALLYLDFAADPYRLDQSLRDWIRIKPSGSAQIFADEKLRIPGRVSTAQTPQIIKIALLLPLASKFGQAAQSVNDGFMAMRALDGSPYKPEIVVYDVGEVPELATSYYQLAINEGANVVVGPLGKQAASALVMSGVIQVPTLLLGGVENESALPLNAFELDLSPEQEAREVAERAFLSGNRVAGVLRPDSEWGQRVAQAFVQQWEFNGGVVAETQVYEEGSNDHSFAIKEILNLSTSEGRKSTLKVLLNEKLEFEPRRRHDLDLLFLAARPTTARLMQPQINFFQAHDIPVYATSHVFTGKNDAINDADLNRITFGDMPWVLRSDARSTLLRNSLPGWKQPNGALNRLFALGMDAYVLSGVIPYLQPNQTLELRGVTADRLNVTENRHIKRQLTWAQFRDGEPTIIDFKDERDGYEDTKLDPTERSGEPLGTGSTSGTTSSPILN